MKMYAWAVRFKREATKEKSSGWESGIGIGPNPDDLQVIIDSNFELVPAPIYMFSNNYHDGTISIEIVK